MFIVILRFSQNKSQASDFMEAHNQWIKRGFEDEVFLMVGSIHSNFGGAIIVQGESRAALEWRVNQDPFVVENIVKAEILEIDPKRVDPRLGFLVEN